MATTKKKRKRSIPLEAHQLIYGERRGDYGPAERNFEKACKIFEILTGIKIEADEGMLYILCLKLARESEKHKRDNLVDVAGYAGLIGDIRD